MAPKRKRSSEVSPNRELEIKPISRTDPFRRVTRSIAIKDGSPSSTRTSSPRKQQGASKRKGKTPIRKPPKKAPKKAPKKTPKSDDDDHDDDVDDDEAEEEEKKKKNSASGDDDDKNAAAATEAGTDVGGSSSSSKTTIIIEHCKQCQSFKKRADKAKAGLEKNVPGINVLINPDKPRKGCFEIRAEGGKAFVSLQDMKRPFKPMKDLDMDEVVADIVKELGE